VSDLQHYHKAGNCPNQCLDNPDRTRARPRRREAAGSEGGGRGAEKRQWKRKAPGKGCHPSKEYTNNDHFTPTQTAPEPNLRQAPHPRQPPAPRPYIPSRHLLQSSNWEAYWADYSLIWGIVSHCMSAKEITLISVLCMGVVGWRFYSNWRDCKFTHDLISLLFSQVCCFGYVICRGYCHGAWPPRARHT